MSIDFMPYVFDTAGGVWRVPPFCETDDDRFSINMCNANALDVIERLSYPGMSISDPPVCVFRRSRPCIPI